MEWYMLLNETRYLQPTKTVDWQHQTIIELSDQLAQKQCNRVEYIKICFEWVRDSIYHSSDHVMNPITIKASDVLKFKTGLCYAKSNLLVALLRAKNIPAGLCYQRVYAAENLFYLHGLTAVYLDDIGWFRMDARGNKQGFDAQFTPPIEKLPYKPLHPGEMIFPEIWPDTPIYIQEHLARFHDIKDLQQDYPDIEVCAS